MKVETISYLKVRFLSFASVLVPHQSSPDSISPMVPTDNAIQVEPSHEQVVASLPSHFPREYDDSRIPLRVQVYNDKPVLHNVLTKPKKGVYMCSHCDTTFASFVQLLDHIDANDIKRPHKCSYDDCPWKIVGFNRVRQLKRHIGSVHTTTKDYRCLVDDCYRCFTRVDLFNRHVKSVHENKLSRFNTKLQRKSSTLSIQTSSSADDIQSRSHGISESISSQTSSPTLTPLSPSVSFVDTEPPSATPAPTPIANNTGYKHSIRFLTNDE